MKNKFSSILALLVLILLIGGMSVISATNVTQSPHIWLSTPQVPNIKMNAELYINVNITENPGIVSLTLPMVWDADCMELISVEKTEELFPNWYGSEETDVWDGMYYLAWNNDIYHDGSFGKADYSNDGILCTMIFRMKKDMEIDELTIYVDSANPIANIMNWEMEDYLHKNTTDSIYGENDFLFTSGVVAFVEEYGDLNFDGIVNVLDAVYLLSHVYDAEGYPIDKNVDYNQDNKITEADALYLLRHTIIPERYPIS